MKTKTRFISLVVLASVLSAGALRAAAPDDKTEFRNAFTQAMKINAYDQMAALVKKYPEQATFWIMETAEGLSYNPSDTLFERIEAQKRAWRASYRTEFVAEMEKYFSLLGGIEKRERTRFKSDYDKKLKLYYEVIGKSPKDIPRLTILGNDFEGLAEGFRQVGDFFYTSQCWIFVAQCNDEVNKGDKADLKKACAAFGSALEFRDKIFLKDKAYLEIQPRFDALVALGFGPNAGKPGEDGQPGAGAAAVAKAAGAAATIAMGFEPWVDVKVPRPNYMLDDLHPMWNALSLRGNGSSTGFLRLEPQPTVMRIGANEVKIDVDKDGEGDVEIPITGNRELIEFEVGEGGQKRKWAFQALTGTDKDTFQGDIQLNSAPQGEYLTIYMAPAGSVVGNVDGVPVRVVDDNLDGIYGSNATPWLHQGLVEGSTHPEFDSVLVGAEKRARPWSEYQKIGDKWFKLDIESGGTQIVASPVELKTGKLALEFKGPKPQFVIVKGENVYENSYFDLVGAKQVEVPVGRYSLFFGILRAGKKQQMVKGMMLPGAATPKWIVAEGETVPVELGKPFDIRFSASADEDQVTIKGDTLCVEGKAGELYQRLWGCSLRPQASWRKVGSKRGSKGEKMVRLMNQQDLNDEGWKWGWFPMTLSLPIKKKSSDGIEVQLVDKKNKLFGKLTSSWRKAE